MTKFKSFFKQNKSTIFFMFLIFSFSLFLLIYLQKDTDYYWHIKAGEYMVTHQKILTHDVFSWFLCGKYWMSHEWLFEVILYQFSCLFPKIHLALFIFLAFFGLNLFLYFTNRSSYQKNIPFSLAWIACSIIFYGMLQARPHMFSFIFCAICLYLLFDLQRNENSKKVYFLPVLSILWANIHGGSSNLPYLLIFLFLFSGMFSFSFSKIEAMSLTKKQKMKYLMLFFLCIFATSINPHGVKMIIYPYQNMANRLMQENISEWQSTSLNEFTHYLYLVLVVFIGAILLFSRKKIRFLDLLLFLFSLFLGMKSIRFWGYTYIFATYMIFDYIPSRKYDRGTYFILGLLSSLCIFIFFFNISRMNQIINSKLLDDKIIMTLKKERPKRLYNFYDYGGYLIYQDILVFVDGRADLYSPYNYRDYINLSNLRGDYEEIINQYDFDYYLIPESFPIFNYLKNNDDFDEVIHKDGTFLYKKRA